jgi:hypothetical protein
MNLHLTCDGCPATADQIVLAPRWARITVDRGPGMLSCEPEVRETVFCPGCAEKCVTMLVGLRMAP